jgi:hypothetical protein
MSYNLEASGLQGPASTLVHQDTWIRSNRQGVNPDIASAEPVRARPVVAPRGWFDPWTQADE